jgi:hypothetical protein
MVQRGARQCVRSTRRSQTPTDNEPVKRARLWLGVMVAGLLVAVGLVLVGPGDGVERLLYSTARTLRVFMGSSSGPSSIAFMTNLPPQAPGKTSIFAELRKSGWVTKSWERNTSYEVCVLVPASRENDRHVLFLSSYQRCSVTYFRPASAVEHAVHRVKAALHIAD